MPGFVLSSLNQTFASLEQKYGQAAALSSAQQIVASELHIQQTAAPSARRDKSGSRTCTQMAGGPRATAFELRSFLTSQNESGLPFCDALFAAAMGTSAVLSAPLTVVSTSASQTVTTLKPHQLAEGSAVAFGGEIRFVTAVPSEVTVALCAPFSSAPGQNSVLSPAATYRLATGLPSVTLFDFWGSRGSFSRVLSGAVVDQFEIDVTGDQHGLRWTGNAADLVDSAAFVPGAAGLSVCPELPSQTPIEYSVVSGHLGQVWLGNPTSLAYTVTQATVRLRNNVALRDREMSSGLPSGFVSGRRVVEADISLLAQNDEVTTELYQVARDRGSISLLLQLGGQTGQMMAAYLPCMVPSIPTYEDSDQWLSWRFTNSQAMGQADDELYLAFA